MQRFALTLVSLTFAAACAEAPKAPSESFSAASAPAPAPAAEPAPAPAPAPTPVVAHEPDPAHVNAYKRVVAEKIAKSNPSAIKTDAKRPADAAIAGLTVVGVQVLADGSTERVWVVRSSSRPKLDQAAIDSVTKSLPLPLPPENVTVGRGYTVFAESWIHRNDGRFQLVSKTR